MEDEGLVRGGVGGLGSDVRTPQLILPLRHAGCGQEGQEKGDEDTREGMSVDVLHGD